MGQEKASSKEKYKTKISIWTLAQPPKKKILYVPYKKKLRGPIKRNQFRKCSLQNFKRKLFFLCTEFSSQATNATDLNFFSRKKWFSVFGKFCNLWGKKYSILHTTLRCTNRGFYPHWILKFKFRIFQVGYNKSLIEKKSRHTKKIDESFFFFCVTIQSVIFKEMLNRLRIVPNAWLNMKIFFPFLLFLWLTNRIIQVHYNSMSPGRL